MLNESPSALKRLVTSLKVAALVTVLGTVVLAAERQLSTTEVSPEGVVATDLAPAQAAAPAASTSTASATAAPSTPSTPDDYFPAQFPEPQGEPAPQPPTF
jgi:hypothetical protein